MRTISQRELRNDSGAIMRALAAGESFQVTSRGEPVGVLTPADRTPLDELTLHRAGGPMRFPVGVTRDESALEALIALRGDR
ncbi:hypothetical protein ARHIZOSPH14_19620 [Agromyces rhizosphaerae]|uniref:Antitoxin n=1 Tax=Agromyces rhizosphaerae TaxID=88374 RepID=A0A9W6FPQ9_9MICO|nr:type II toxin-antitoxin system prevent-host-death family antitoxin [Agromyces rhizosphaerae]GLI27720.1 hypothetical protein ARHIZOSPH14_19620 [Agromyces rhizosphaerae]